MAHNDKKNTSGGYDRQSSGLRHAGAPSLLISAGGHLRKDLSKQGNFLGIFIFVISLGKIIRDQIRGPSYRVGAVKKGTKVPASIRSI